MTEQSAGARILVGDCREILRTLPADSAHCVVTSPPYWGLRDYGVDGQLGLEGTPEEYVRNLVAAFREVRRVLRPDGTAWLVLGDSYATGAGRVGAHPGGGHQGERWKERGSLTPPNRMPVPGLKPKDLVGAPWAAAFALRADGWWLRSGIVWSKGNPMPESVRDRPTQSHEFVFLLAKSRRYFYDAVAVEEESVSDHPSGNRERLIARDGERSRLNTHLGSSVPWEVHPTRNRRSVWEINTRPYPEAHFAVFPPELAEVCILAGTSARGCCPDCGAPWERVTKVVGTRAVKNGSTADNKIPRAVGRLGETSSFITGEMQVRETAGWAPTCECEAGEPVPCTVLDPFAGSGTTGMVATGHGRRAVLIELNPEYVEMARRRIGPLFVEAAMNEGGSE